MAKRVLILGARGRLGRAAHSAFHAAGWTVTAFARHPLSTDTDADWFYGNAFDPKPVAAASEGADVIVNALNPPYHHWSHALPRITTSVLAAARVTGASVLIPGNVYNYGEAMPALLNEQTPHHPTTRKGRLREDMEAAYRDAAQDGIQTIVVRAGDFIERAKTGNWFDTYLTQRISKGVLTYPGPTDLPHAWAYLPDLGRAMAQVAHRRTDLSMFESIGFPGHTFTGAELRDHAATLLGRPVRIRAFPWTMLRLMAIFSPMLREVVEMRYLWNRPHAIDGTKFRRLCPDFAATPLRDVLCDTWADALAPDAINAPSAIRSTAGA